MKLPDDLKHPSGGEHVDELAHSVLRLAHEALNRFPEVKKRHAFLAGGAAVSSALIVAAGVAIMRRVREGQHPTEAVNNVTAEELEGLRLVEREHYRPAGAADAEEPAAPTEDGSKPATGTE
ncbi:MAG: hypothetical protein O2919_09930 [Chloroflexi bacterium]|nr:hypothetical protein [Chloroflexota bacterium]